MTAKQATGPRGRDEYAMKYTSSQCLPCVAHNYDFSKDLIHSSLRLRFAHLRKHVTNDVRGDFPPPLYMDSPIQNRHPPQYIQRSSEK